jgi:hypothetical protein
MPTIHSICAASTPYLIPINHSSDFWKRRGNEAFVAKEYKKAAEAYTSAIKLTGDVGALWSNRSACYLGDSLGLVDLRLLSQSMLGPMPAHHMITFTDIYSTLPPPPLFSPLSLLLSSLLLSSLLLSAVTAMGPAYADKALSDAEVLLCTPVLRCLVLYTVIEIVWSYFPVFQPIVISIYDPCHG